MTAGIRVAGLTKSFASVRAVDEVDFEVAEGRVTAFLGPNGAGKTTTLRMLLGLVRPDAGTATIDGRSYVDIPAPISAVGAALDPGAGHPGRRARDQLRITCRRAGIPTTRADEVLADVGLEDSARRRIGGFSSGMRQRLQLAGALIGDPAVLVLDEPANGLDPEGVHWLRRRVRGWADEGRTVVLSSHLLAEVQRTVDDVVVIAAGRVRYAGPLDAMLRQVATAGAEAPDLEAAFLDVIGAEPTS